VRTELGSRFDAPTVIYGRPLVWYGRLAWAHDFVSNPSLAAFQSLQGASFTVFGAPIPHDSALTTVGAQLHLTPQWTLLAKFDGEFGNHRPTAAPQRCAIRGDHETMRFAKLARGRQGPTSREAESTTVQFSVFGATSRTIAFPAFCVRSRR
jgi:Autotransporter beta-domain